MERTEKSDLKVSKVCLDLWDQWVTKDLLESLAKTEFQERLEILDHGETQEKMVLLVSTDLQVLLVLLEREELPVHLVLEASKECLDHLENLVNLEKMAWPDYLDNLV